MGLFDSMFRGSAPKASTPTEVQRTRWRGASRTLRSLQAWWTQTGSGRSDLPSDERKTLTNRSRDAFRGHLIARAALTRSRTNIVGTGLMCRPAVDARALGLSEDAAEDLNQQIRAHFEPWAENANECDMEMASDFYGLQGLALLSAMLSGDVGTNTPYKLRPGGIYGLKVQLIEADRINNPNNEPDSDALTDGIQYDGAEPVGYWVQSNHPGDALTSVTIPTWTLYPAIGAETGRRRFLHVWNDKERPGQARGAPYLAPILEPLRQLARYGDAELMAAVVSAMFTIFLEKSQEKTDDNGDPVAAFDAPVSGNASPEATVPGTVALGVGAVNDLAPGEKAVFANPTRPNANYDPFFMSMVKQIGAALELPVDELLLHYQSSYSAARAAMLQAWRFYTLRRWALTTQFCQPIYGLWMDEAVATGKLKLPDYGDPVKRAAYSRALWIGPARGSMDEQKEAGAAQARIEAGLSNETIETAAMMGEDWLTVNAGRAREIRIKKENGTWIDKSPAPVVATEKKPEDSEKEIDPETGLPKVPKDD